ncbi:TolC family protein [Desulfobacula toluolica]|uniref:Outer membrane efflux protein n=1 Tax=Desulfobacula toluolica (strain DSM 7467 / Tol2) TaxID=651182 RepID=K0NLP5_DESTT|nr:TolC family protein [Desulfobacula toluolica]CCK79562.1 outer membrane efflux protein [Desulfobacula toluolica Tol2]
MKYPIFYNAFILVFTLTLLNGMAFAGQTMTLEQCLETGIKNNPSLKAAGLGVAAAGHDIKAARADFLPAVSSGYSYSMLGSISSKGPTETDYLDQESRTFNIKMTQILYAGSRVVNAYGKAKILEQAAQAQMDLEKLELIYNIEITFYRVMKARQDVITVTESVNRLSESIKSAKAFFEKELVPYVDVLQARVDLADAKEQLGIAKNNLNRERVALFALMDLPLDPDMEFSGGQYNTVTDDPSFESCLQQAFENRPDIKSLEYQLDAANKDAGIAMGKYMPMVRLDIGYYDQDRDYDKPGTSISGDYDRDQRNRYWSTGIYATWDMFDGGRSWYEKEKYNAQASKIKSLIKEAENMISTGIHKALYSMSEAQQRISTSGEALIAAKEYYEMEEKRLNAGLSTVPSLLDAQYRLIRAQGNQTRAVLDYQLAKSELKLMTAEK